MRWMSARDQVQLSLPQNWLDHGDFTQTSRRWLLTESSWTLARPARSRSVRVRSAARSCNSLSVLIVERPAAQRCHFGDVSTSAIDPARLRRHAAIRSDACHPSRLKRPAAPIRTASYSPTVQLDGRYVRRCAIRRSRACSTGDYATIRPSLLGGADLGSDLGALPVGHRRVRRRLGLRERSCCGRTGRGVLSAELGRRHTQAGERRLGQARASSSAQMGDLQRHALYQASCSTTTRP